MKTIFKTTDSFIVRQPCLPYNSLFDILNDKNKAFRLISSNDFHRALLWVSNNLNSEYARFLNDELNEKDSKRMWMTLMKYAIRMCTRSTPFGEFATISSGKIGEESKLQDFPPHKRYIYIDSLLENLLFIKIRNKDLLKQNQSFSYCLNGSIIKKGSFYFFLRKTENGRVIFSSFESNPILQYLLQSKIKSFSYKKLLELLSKRFDFKETEIKDFFISLINNDILIPSIRPEAMNTTWLGRVRPYLSFEDLETITEIMNNLKQIEIEDSANLINNSLNKINTALNFDTSNTKCIVQTVCYGKSSKRLSRKTVRKVIDSISFFSKVCK
ncbi:MAG: lantibiotic dehydratase family protein, partial [Muribaculaceae bacterium]|nr:lantibiotic dehydratase family protein [Muribaculaceae bacterium]